MNERNLKLFYIHELLFRFSDSMLFLILPIFIYQLYDSISAVFIFIAIWNLIHSILYIPIFNLAMRWKKPKYFMMLGIIFYIAALYIFGQITTDNIQLMIPATIFFALFISTYWMVKHWFISTNANHNRIGRQMSIAGIIRTVVSFLGPLTAGVISYYFTFGSAFTMGAFVGLLSLIPIMLFNAPATTERYNFKRLVSVLRKPEIKAISPAFICEAVGFTMILNGWLLAFFIFIGSMLDLGILVGATTFITAILIWLAGKWFDKKKRRQILLKTSVFGMISAMLYSTIFFFPNMIYVWIVEFMNKLAFSTHLTVAESYLYGYGNKINPIEFPMVREFYLNITRFVISIALAIAFLHLSETFLWVVILIGSLNFLGQLTLRNSDHLLND